jgi:2,3-bisphosphoglycerate-independent phosphoglycerate mutase
MSQRAILIVLDGFGIGKDSQFNAIANAQMPFYRQISLKYPHSQLITHGEAVGLPEGVMGNSEVGHMTMGSGRVTFQDLTRISKTIQTGEFFKNPVLRAAIEAGAQKTGRVHLMGLLSDGGVHSHIDHLLALLDLCSMLKVPKVSVHPFLDGRDTPPDSAPIYLQKLLEHPTFKNSSDPTQTQAQIVTVMGRYWGMDRDNRWDRVAKAYAALTGQMETTPTTALEVVQKSYALGKSDEFVEPTLLAPDGAMKDGDSAIFFNFRSDRAREMTHALTTPDFKEFNLGRGCHLSAFAGMTSYDKNLAHAQVAFRAQSQENILGEWLEKKKLHQLRIAETEKYAHVTFFFNGGREAPFVGEDRILVPSPKDVPTYDLKPEMSAYKIAEEAARNIREKKHDFILMNFANADMVGHTGNYQATVQAVETLDHCLATVIGAAESSGYHVLLTSDHGNAEEMKDSVGRIHTQHTLNPVPVIWVAPNSSIAPKTSRLPLKDGDLSDVMPTLCKLMKLDIPHQVTGKSLLPENLRDA